MTGRIALDGAQDQPLTSDDMDAEQADAAEAREARASADGIAEQPDEERYRLVSIDSVKTPEGCAGRDWFVYRIEQGKNAITGYRRGDRDKVGADVDTIVAALNGRREWAKRKPESKAHRRAAAAARRKGA
jgi:hypothetical protein